jgi:hypothetical protein
LAFFFFFAFLFFFAAFFAASSPSFSSLESESESESDEELSALSTLDGVQLGALLVSEKQRIQASKWRNKDLIRSSHPQSMLHLC